MHGLKILTSTVINCMREASDIHDQWVYYLKRLHSHIIDWCSNLCYTKKIVWLNFTESVQKIDELANNLFDTHWPCEHLDMKQCTDICVAVYRYGHCYAAIASLCLQVPLDMTERCFLLVSVCMCDSSSSKMKTIKSNVLLQVVQL